MAQLRQEHDRLAKLDVEVLVVGPEKPQAFRDHWAKESLPFIGLPDPTHSVIKLYGQEVKIFKFGRMPAQMLIDKSGILRFVYYGQSMSDIPSVDDIEQALLTQSAV
jgi:peroxiredoxin Q/BCP